MVARLSKHKLKVIIHSVDTKKIAFLPYCLNDFICSSGGRLIQAEIIETKRSGDVFNTPEILNNTVDIGLEIAKNGVGACGELFRSGFNYYETVVRDEMTATNSESCAKMCKLKPYCNSFSFR